MTDKLRNIILIVLIIIGCIGILLVGTMIEILAYIGLCTLVISAILAFFVLNWDWFSKKK